MALIFGLAIGIHRNSRIAATLMFDYFLLSKILAMVETGKPTGLVVAIAFLIFYVRQWSLPVATYRFHGFLKLGKRFPSPARQAGQR